MKTEITNNKGQVCQGPYGPGDIPKVIEALTKVQHLLNNRDKWQPIDDLSYFFEDIEFMVGDGVITSKEVPIIIGTYTPPS